MSARDRILAKLNAAPVLPKAEPDVASWYETHRSQESAVDKASRFRSCIELAHAEVYSVTSASWLQKLWEVLSAKQIGKLLVAPGTPHGRRAIDAAVLVDVRGSRAARVVSLEDRKSG